MFTRRPYLFNLVLFALALLLSVAVGAVTIPFDALLDLLFNRPAAPELYAAILYQVRLPHTALVALVGAALAGSGAAYQGLFRNPLADPYLIGAASGAGLGAVLALSANWPSELLGFYTVPAAAFLGALMAVGAVYALAQVGGSMPTTTLVLAGVAVASFTTAVTSYLLIRSEGEVRRAIAWLLGGSTLAGWPPVIAAAPYVAIGLGALLLSGHALNVLQFGEDQALQLGLPVRRVRTLIVLAASLTTAAAVAFSGVIGFIGLIVPHLVRFLWGPDYRRLIPLAAIGGATALLIADMIARRVIAPQTLPVGVITALVGAPFFLWILRRVKGQVYW